MVKKIAFFTMLTLALLLAWGIFAPEAFSQAEPSPTPVWVGEITSQAVDLSLVGTVLRVSVEGIKGLPVKVSSGDDWRAVGLTGTKSEYGDYVVEFAPLSQGYYTVEPMGLHTKLSFYADGKSYIFIRFSPQSATPTPTTVTTIVPTSSPTSTPTLTPTLPPPTPTSTALPPPTSVAAPMPTSKPPPLWQGNIVYQIKGPFYAALAVRIPGQKGLPVEIKSDGWRATAVTGTKPEYGDFACEFGGLSAGTYTITPLGLGTSLNVDFGQGGFALVEFVPRAAPPPLLAFPTPVPPELTLPVTTAGAGWAGYILLNTSGPEAKGDSSVIIVLVPGLKGLPVELRAGALSARAVTGAMPEYGSFGCGFSQLWPGTYQVIPEGLGVTLEVTMDGQGLAVVEFRKLPEGAD